MSRSLVKPLWVLLVFISTWTFLLLDVRAQWPYSSNPNDYDFGWLASGVHAPGSEPYCTYCINGVGYDANWTESNADLGTHGPFWNRTVGIYRCDGVENNEMWVYHEPSNSIVFGNFTMSKILCVDAASWSSQSLLKLRPCNTSSDTQRWTKKGNSLFSKSLRGSNGSPLLMVGAYPNKATYPSNQDYVFHLSLNSFLPSESNSKFLYTDNFTFLSANNFKNRSTPAFTLEGLLGIKDSPQDIDQIVNGGFESSTIQAGYDISWSDWNPTVPSYFSLCGWVIYGVVDYVKSGFLQSADGSYSVHLNSHSDKAYASTISQAFKTDVGKEYILSFSFNGFPANLTPQFSQDNRTCSATYTTALLQVRVASGVSTDITTGASSDGSGLELKQNFTMDITQTNLINVGAKWRPRTLIFKASTNATIISFSSLNFNDSCGPLIDKVSVIEKHNKKAALVWILVGTICGLAILAAGILGLVYRRKCSGDNDDYSGLYKTENARVFSVKELRSSTKKFSAVLGEGAFGTVYKADFPDGTTGAVKVEKPRGLLSSSKVLASGEIAVLLRVHHRNLVNLIGFCINKGRHMLVFEYLPNGTLYERLHQSVLPSTLGLSTDSIEQLQLFSITLSWQKRVKIASDVASGLEYLHHDADPPIVHRDVKSQNILLTATDSAKLSDFGLSKAAPAEATSFQSIETMVRGSIGYLDPQYFLTGVFSTKSDVYSYGVVLLELISGHQAIYNAASLASWAAPYMANPSLYHELVDTKLEGKVDATELESLVDLAKMCMLDDGKIRPTMRQVVAYLHSKNLLVPPGGDSSEQVEESIESLRENWHRMHPLFIDFESVPTDSGSAENFVPSIPQPRD